MQKYKISGGENTVKKKGFSVERVSKCVCGKQMLHQQ
jgi:hypothetical protein